MKTLTSIGIQKIGQRFVDSVDHADYTLNGVPQTAEPFRRFVQGASARVYIYFDDTVIGGAARGQRRRHHRVSGRTGLHKNTGQGALYSLQI